MKTSINNVILFFLSIGVACTMTSCVRYVDDEESQIDGGGNYSQQSYGGQQGPTGQGQQRVVTGQKKIAHTTTLRAFVKLAGDAPQAVTDRAEQATANEAGFLYAKSFESGGKPCWPTLEEIKSVAARKYAANGYNLSPGRDGQPGCFMITAYKPGVK